MFLESAWHVLLQLAPWLLFGTFIAGLVHVFLPSGFIHRKLQGPGGVAKAVAIGVPLPLCSCGVIPAGIGLKKDGASDGACIGFLISTPQTGVDSILVSASFLGWPFAVFRVLSAAVTGLAGGLLVDLLDGKRGAKEALSPAQESPAVRQPRLAGMFKHGLDIIRSIWLWIVVGILVSAAIEVFVPPSFLAGIGELGIVASAFIALAISLPLYVCATASVPIAAALVAGGLPPGAALVFLMAGPATNVATIGAVYRQFGGRVLAAYLGTIILGSTLAAVAFDWLVPAANALPAAAHHEHSAWWAEASAVLLLGLFAWFAVEKLTSWYRRGASQRRESGEVEVRFAVRGMKCGNCVARLEQSLRKAEGVRSAVVHLDPGEAIVRGAVDRGRIRETILQAGFQPE